MAPVSQESTFRDRKLGNPLCAMRILVCGKGGSGKSSIVAMMARVLRDLGYGVLVIDGDASNPGGLARFLFGAKKAPQPLIEFFGGRTAVECPVDNPAPLTRLGDTRPVPEQRLEMNEIPSRYSLRENGLTLFQVGKIEQACEGCDGPMSKVTRDLIVKGDQVTLIDVEAGVEHFGRGVEQNVNVVLVTVDPTLESFLVAERVAKLCGEMGIEKVWAILNKVGSREIESSMLQALAERKVEVLGCICEDPKLLRAGLKGTPLGRCAAMEDIERMIKRLEELA